MTRIIEKIDISYWPTCKKTSPMFDVNEISRLGIKAKTLNDKLSTAKNRTRTYSSSDLFDLLEYINNNVNIPQGDSITVIISGKENSTKAINLLHLQKDYKLPKINLNLKNIGITTTNRKKDEIFSKKLTINNLYFEDFSNTHIDRKEGIYNSRNHGLYNINANILSISTQKDKDQEDFYFLHIHRCKINYLVLECETLKLDIVDSEIGSGKHGDTLFIKPSIKKNTVNIIEASFKNTTFHTAPLFHNCKFHPEMQFKEEQFLDTTSEFAVQRYTALREAMAEVGNKQQEDMFHSLVVKSMQNSDYMKGKHAERLSFIIYGLVSNHGRSLEKIIFSLACSTYAYYIASIFIGISKTKVALVSLGLAGMPFWKSIEPKIEIDSELDAIITVLFVLFNTILWYLFIQGVRKRMSMN